jgi:hypothetical protein
VETWQQNGQHVLQQRKGCHLQSQTAPVARALAAINLNNEIDRRRQEKESKIKQPVQRQKMAAAAERQKALKIY